MGDNAVRSEVAEIAALAKNGEPLTLTQQIKIGMYFAGTVEGMHVALDALRANDPSFPDPRDPFDHNVEQAQIALESVTFRLEQLLRLLMEANDESASGARDGVGDE